jgi:ribosomal protein S18 acetylase RimI-like enzyme
MDSPDCVQGLRICIHPPESEISPELLRLVATGRGSLDFILGDAEQRLRLFRHGLDWSRVAVAWRLESPERPVGYAQMRFAGRGPYNPGWRIFLKEYGFLHGLGAWLVFHIAELWNWNSPFYFYGLRVTMSERKQGIGEALVKAVMTHAQACGYNSIELDVGPNFVIAKRLYERCGFHEVGRSRLFGVARFLPFRELSFMRCTFSPSSETENAANDDQQH